MTLSLTYNRARDLALAGHYSHAEELFEELTVADEFSTAALAHNGLGVLKAVHGEIAEASVLFETAVSLDSGCKSAARNLKQLHRPGAAEPFAMATNTRRTRIAILSFLFNWPSTGGGIFHTVELTEFLSRAGYDVRLIHPRYEPWGIGRVDRTCPVPTSVLPFAPQEWTADLIRRRFRDAVDEFAPDHVIIMDSWNSKPLLAEAVADYSYFLRVQALECVCPLNNLRLRPAHDGLKQCAGNQLQDPGFCAACVHENDRFSGDLHRAERALSGVDHPEYSTALHRALQGATAVLVLNSAAAQLFEPYARDVRVVTWGMDSRRFPWPPPQEPPLEGCQGLTTLLFAGVVNEPIKGFEVLQAACAQLWNQRRDFRLVVTADPHALQLPFVQSVGWKSQAELSRLYRATDVAAVPTIAQEGLSRTAVEAMACGRSVIGSRLGGMPDVIVDGQTGLLAAPGDADDWSRRIAWMLDHTEERRRMGAAGRERFEKSFTWESVIARQYEPLLGPPVQAAGMGAASRPLRQAMATNQRGTG